MQIAVENGQFSSWLCAVLRNDQVSQSFPMDVKICSLSAVPQGALLHSRSGREFEITTSLFNCFPGDVIKYVKNIILKKELRAIGIEREVVLLYNYVCHSFH